MVRLSCLFLLLHKWLELAAAIRLGDEGGDEHVVETSRKQSSKAAESWNMIIHGDHHQGECVMAFDGSSWTSNEKKAKMVLDVGYQNNFKCPKDQPTLMRAEAGEYEGKYGVFIFCCRGRPNVASLSEQKSTEQVQTRSSVSAQDEPFNIDTKSMEKSKGGLYDGLEGGFSMQGGKHCTTFYDKTVDHDKRYKWWMHSGVSRGVSWQDQTFRNYFRCPEDFGIIMDAEFWLDEEATGVVYTCCKESSPVAGLPAGRTSWNLASHTDGPAYCSMMFDANHWVTNTKKLGYVGMSDYTFQNDFYCPRAYPLLMTANWGQKSSLDPTQGVTFICCNKDQKEGSNIIGSTANWVHDKYSRWVSSSLIETAQVSANKPPGASAAAAWELDTTGMGGKHCTVMYDKHSIFNKKLFSDNTYQNNFGCPKTYPVMMRAELHQNGTSNRDAILFWCCKNPVAQDGAEAPPAAARNSWNIATDRMDTDKHCTMLFDANFWLSNTKKLSAFQDETFQNDFACPKSFPLLVDANYRKIPGEGSIGVQFFCCKEADDYRLRDLQRQQLEAEGEPDIQLAVSQNVWPSNAWNVEVGTAGKKCTMIYDANMWFTNHKKMPTSDTTFQNDFGCPSDIPTMMHAEFYEDDETDDRGVIFFCCDSGEVPPAEAGSVHAWYMKSVDNQKVCTMAYDQNYWLTNTKKLAFILDTSFQNNFNCPSGFPILMDAKLRQDEENLGIIFFCCKTDKLSSQPQSKYLLSA
jgi:hypothetical protein